MVGAYDLVPIGYVGAWSQKEGAKVGHVVEEKIRVARHYLDVLGSYPIRLDNHFFVGFANNDFTVVFPGLRRLLAQRRRRFANLQDW